MPHHQVAARPAISAHRGGGEVAPAGTWDAFSAAVDATAEYVEFDVRLTRDGTWVIYHDEQAGRPGHRVRTLGYDELCEAAGYLVPEATAVMQTLANRVIGHLDLKEFAEEKAIIGPAIDIFGTDGFVATTEHPASVRRMKSFAPAVRTALSTGNRRMGRPQWRRPRFDPRWVLESGADGVALNHRLATDRVLEMFRRKGLGVMLWTVNDQAQISRYLADNRIDVLITDRPRFASAIRSEICVPSGRLALAGVQSAKDHCSEIEVRWS